MFEQQHKLETFLMKDLTAMLSLVVQLPPSQRPEGRRTENLLGKFPKRNGRSRARYSRLN